jgi:hypothetical protein
MPRMYLDLIGGETQPDASCYIKYPMQPHMHLAFMGFEIRRINIASYISGLS